MHIRLVKRVFNRMTDEELRNLERTKSNLRGSSYFDVSLLEMEIEQITAFRDALVRLKESGTRKLIPLIADIDLWRSIMDGSESAGEVRPSTLRQFSELLMQYLLTVPGPRIYMQEEDSKEWLPYYVNYVEYHHEYKDKYGSIQPAYVSIHLLYWLLGDHYSNVLNLHNSDVHGHNIKAALAVNGIVAETDDLRADYLKVKDRFDEVFEKVGHQFTTEGYGVSMSDRYIRRWSRTSLMEEGVAARVVIDVPVDSSDESHKSATARPRNNFWSMKKPKAISYRSSDDLGISNSRTVVDDTLSEPPEIPVHPFIPVYHLGRHRRYRVNVKELQEYRFNKDLSEQLVLPEITKDLIDVLVSQGRISFRDIVEGKGSGACLLLGGPPGVGKTLTAEVFAEATERPLLTVQAAQLGTNPDKIESQFRRILQLGSRWNAVVLLDEADVYIARRGTDLHQNAIVAAFLRMLESHSATIFMTTNRVTDVDDAVLSRCLARITYSAPDQDSQRRIWKIMSNLNGVNLPESAIDEIVHRHDSLTGRDIKQVVKLAALWATRNNEEVTPDTIDFVTEFLPTISINGHGSPVDSSVTTR